MESPDSGLRGNNGAPRGQDDRSRDPQSPHSLPVSTVQALIDQWRAEAARIDAFHATMGTGYHVCADQLAALLASPSLPHAQWRSIETLPEGLDFFLAAWACAGSATGYDVGEVLRDGDGFFNLTGRLSKPPTHWMPLPASPSLHRQEQEQDEAPTCEQHGTMVADDERGTAWHCAVCPARSPSLVHRQEQHEK